jgi:RNA polymerase sigma-70 factor (ECF subfamily)
MITEWKSHKSELKRYVEKQITDPNVVDDILQEIYIKASNNLHQLKVRGSLRKLALSFNP